MKSLIKKIKLKKYQDRRGELVENTFRKIVTDSKHFFVSKSVSGAIRGNHYHKRKSEWFHVIQGTCKVYAIDIKTKTKEELTIQNNQNIIINFKPMIAHAFKNIGKDEMILLALVNEVHDQKDPDTYSYKII